MPRSLIRLFWLYVVCVTAACAASVVVVPVESVTDWLIKWGWVGMISLLAWAASSLPVLADWPGATGRTRLMIAQSVLKALFVGYTAFGGSVVLNQNIIASYLAAASAAFACDAYYRRRDEQKDPDKPNAEGAK